MVEATGNQAQRNEEQPEVPLRWWGVSLGSQAFASHAPNRDRAIDLVFEKLGVSREENDVLPVFSHPHEDEFQPQLTERFGATEQAVKVIPFSMDPWPEPQSDTH